MARSVIVDGPCYIPSPEQIAEFKRRMWERGSILAPPEWRDAKPEPLPREFLLSAIGRKP